MKAELSKSESSLFVLRKYFWLFFDAYSNLGGPKFGFRRKLTWICMILISTLAARLLAYVFILDSLLTSITMSVVEVRK